MSRLYVLLLLLLAVSCKEKKDVVQRPEPTKVLVLTETQGYRHESIEAGVEMFELNAEGWGLDVQYSGESSTLISEDIDEFSFIVLLSTTGDYLDDNEQFELREYVEQGGGILGIHAATDAEYDWQWYGHMLGARFNDHPQVQEANCIKANELYNSGIPAVWTRTDEWYNFSDVSPENVTLISLDEQTYEGGTMGNAHPISWYRQVGNGRVFYTGMGHTSETYSEPLFIQHIANAVDYLIK